MEFRSFWQNKSCQYPGSPGGARWRLTQCVMTGLIALLLASGARAESLLDAAAIGDIREVQLYLDQGADVNAMDADSFRPLHWAAFGGYTEVVELLVTNGAAIEVQNADGLTPLHAAVLAGHPEVVKRLIASGANTAAITRTGNTARDMAVIRGRTAIVHIFDEQPVLARYQTVASKSQAAPVENGTKTVESKRVVVPPEESRAVTQAGSQPGVLKEEQSPPGLRPMVSLSTPVSPSPSKQNATGLQAAVESPPASSTPPGRFLIQLAAVRSESTAQRIWGRYQKRFPDVLGTHQLLVERVDLVQKGIFYRVRTGPFADRDQAEAICLRLKAHKKACLIIHH